MPGPSEWLESIALVLERLDVRWAVIGALAANQYRRSPRFTTDVDALVEADPDLVEALQAAGYEVQQVASPGEPPHLLRLTRDEERIDILVPVVSYQQEALARALDHVLAPEDVIIHKLIAWRSRDKGDIREILENAVPLDERYIERWVEAWELEARWSEARTWR